MNCSCLAQSFTYSPLQEERGFLSPATEKSPSYLGRSRCSVKTINLSDARYLGLEAIEAPGFQRTLDDIPIFHSPPDSEIMLVKRPNNSTVRQLLTNTVRCATTESSRFDKPVSGKVCTSPAYTADTGQYALNLSDAGNLGLEATEAPGFQRTLDDIPIFHSPPDSEIMLVKRPNNSTVRQLLTNTVRCATTESSRFDQPVSGKVCTSPAYTAGTGQYARADQANRGNIQGESFAAVKGNKAEVNGTPYAELRKSPEKYQTTDNGQKSKVSYRIPGSNKRVRTKLSPRERRLSRAKAQAKYYRTVKGRLAQCIASAKHVVFKTALREGLSEEAAREKSEEFAKEKRAQLTKKLLTRYDRYPLPATRCPLPGKNWAAFAGSGKRAAFYNRSRVSATGISTV